MRTLIARALVALGLLAMALPAIATAAEGSLVGVRPVDPNASWLVLTMEPGQVVRQQALVMNLTDRPQPVRLSSADAVTTADGVFTLAGEHATPAGVGAWITPDETRITLAPNERRAVGLTIREPAGTTPGDHAGGLVVQSDEPAETGGGEGVAVRVLERVGMRVYVTVPGTRDGRVAIEDLDATAAGDGAVRGAVGLPDAVDVRFRVRNRGNVNFTRLSGRVDLLEGDDVRESRPLDFGTMLPGDDQEVAMSLPLPTWSPGSYRVRVTVAGAPATHTQATVDVGAGRVYAAGGLMVGLVGLGGAGLWRRRNRRAA
ncbi:MAG: DUF916 domain-containing protein [Thermoleophilia bacterium]